MRHLSDSERLTQAMLRKREEELKQSRLIINQYIEQLETMKEHITELKGINNFLTKQISNLVSYQRHHA
jgi:hypothetical protein